MFLRATRVQTPANELTKAIQHLQTNIKNLRAPPGSQGVVLVINGQTCTGDQHYEIQT